MTLQARPTIFVLAGPNGAGKSTLYKTRVAPHVAAEFVNADQIQRDELRDPSMEASYNAAQLAEQRRRELMAAHQDLVTESTFSHPSKLQLLDDARVAGYRVMVFHVNVASADLSVARVAARVAEGGHDVPEDKARERYVRNQSLIRTAVLQADRAFVYDNSRLNMPPQQILEFVLGHLHAKADDLPAWAEKLYAKNLK